MFIVTKTSYSLIISYPFSFMQNVSSHSYLLPLRYKSASFVYLLLKLTRAILYDVLSHINMSDNTEKHPWKKRQPTSKAWL